MAVEIQRSFTGGELAPALYARDDLARKKNGMRTCLNWEVMRHGGIQNRPGFVYVAETKYSDKASRLIPFVFNNEQTASLEFGDLYVRIIQDGAVSTYPTKNIEAITQANPGVFQVTGHGYSNGDHLAVLGVEGMVDLNNRVFIVAGVTANTFTLKYMDGTAVDTTAFDPYTMVFAPGTVEKIYEVVSPYADTDLPLVKYAQSGDVVNLVHPDFPPYELRRVADLNWTLTPISFLPTIDRPVALAATAGAGGALTTRYKVTSIAKKGNAESLPAIQAAKVISAATAANPVVVTSVAHGYSNGDEVLITGVVGMTQLNGKVFIVNGVTANTFQLLGIDGTAYTAYVSGGSAFKTLVTLAASATPTLVAPNVITWTTDPLAQEYNVYREISGQFALLGITPIGSFSDIGLTVDMTKTPPVFKNPFDSAGNYPSTVSYHQQRLSFGNTDNEPQTVWESRIGSLHDFSISSPLQDDDAVTYTPVGIRVQEIKHLLDLGRFIIFSSGAEMTAGDEQGAVTPFFIPIKKQSGHGASDLQPIDIDGSAIFVQARGSKVRDLAFNFQKDGYQGNDLTVWSTHLFDGYELLDWAFQQEPDSIVWIVRDDGSILGLTYLREQEIYAWHRHTTDGLFESVCSIPEGDIDALYAIVQRTVELNGVDRTVRYVERRASRRIDAIEDCIFMDAAATYDGRNTSDETATLTTAGGWTATDLLTATISGPYDFTADDVGNCLFLTGADGTKVKLEITQYISANVVKGLSDEDVPASLQAVATTTWSKAVDEVAGLWHLEGKLISVLGDGAVVCSPANKQYTRVRVANGRATLPECYAVIHAGLFYASSMETLDMDTVEAETMTGKPKLIGKLTAFVQLTRGLWCGDRPPSPDPTDLETSISFVEGLTETPIKQPDNINEAGTLVTDSIATIMDARWNKNGRVFMRQVDPLPATILSLGPEGLIPR